MSRQVAIKGDKTNQSVRGAFSGAVRASKNQNHYRKTRHGVRYITLQSTHHRHIFPDCNVARLLAYPGRRLADMAVGLVPELSIYDRLRLRDHHRTLIKVRIGEKVIGKSQRRTRNNS